MTFVVDASALLQALAPDEEGDVGAEVLVRIELTGAIAPQAFADEIVHAAAKGVRMRRWSDAVARRMVERTASLDIRIMDRVAVDPDQLDVALTTGLSGADASYVHLARETGLPLATADRTMRAAAERAGVRTML